MQTAQIVTWLFLFAPTPTAAPSPVPIRLAVGAEQRIELPQLRRVAVGDPEVADIRSLGGAIVVIGASPGTTTVLAWMTGETAPRVFEVTVTATGSTSGPAPAPSPGAPGPGASRPGG